MALADRISIKPKNFAEWFEDLPPNHRATIEGWLRDRKVSAMKIVEAIRSDDPDDDFTGFHTHKDTINSWRRVNL